MVVRRVYLDASALVRLVLAEPGWEALAEYLAANPERVVSAIAVTEVRRAVLRSGGSVARARRAEDVLARVDLVAVTADILRRAGDLRPTSLRTIDAIHVATAMEIGPIVALATYDHRLAEAALANGLQIAAPG